MSLTDDEQLVTRTRGARAAQARWYAQRATHATARTGLRLIHPTTVGRSVVAAALGAERAARAVWDTVTAARLGDLRVRDPRRHHEIRRFRTIASLLLLALMVFGVRWLVGRYGVLAWCSLGAALLFLLVLLGRRGPVLAPAPELAGLVPADMVVRQALVDARLAKDVDQVRVVQPVARDRGAWHTVAELPPGVPARKAVAARPAIASALGVGVIQLDLEVMPGNEQRVRIWCADRDPYDRKPVVAPLARHPRPTDIWTPAAVGVDARDHEVLIALVFSGVLIGGLPRMGKTVSANNLLAHVLLDAHAQLVMADGKGLDSQPYRHLAMRVVGRDPDELVDLLEELEADMEQRLDLLAGLGLDKLSKDAAAADRRLAPRVLWIDELRHYTDAPSRPTARLISSKLVELASVGPATGISPLLATQRPSSEVVPTDLRDLIPTRWALPCATPASSDMVLGQGAASAGADASELDQDRKGVGIIRRGARQLTLRSYMLGIDEMRRVGQAATELRRAAGTIPINASPREVPPLLAAIWSAFAGGEGIDRLPTALLLDVLGRANPEWLGLDGAELARQLAVYDVRPGQLGGPGNPRGYKRDTVGAAIERITGRRPA